MRTPSPLQLLAALLAAAGFAAAQDAVPAPRAVPEDPPDLNKVLTAPKAKVIPEDAPTPSTETPAAPPKAKVVKDDEEVPSTNEKKGDSAPAIEERKAEVPKTEKPAPKKDEVIKVKAVKSEELPVEKPPVKEPKSLIPVSDRNDRNARTLFLTIPAPRGQIVDRNGNVLAQNRMAYFLGLQFNLPAEASDAEVLRYARQRIVFIQKHMPDGWDIKDSTVLEHYRNRRWLPLLATRPVPTEATEAARKELPPGVIMVPNYLRSYPHGTLACHLLGQMGKAGGMSTQPIQNGDPIWPLGEGKGGLESRFDKDLQGTPGKVNLVFSATGEKVGEEIVEHPIPGNTLVTSLDLEIQLLVERVLAQRTRRGAMVIMDVQTGDIIAMASNPGYDPNLFAFGIREQDYKPLLVDPDVPLLGRAINAAYQPASTFKVITALAALESGKVDGGTHYDCDTSIYIGDRYFHNWAKSGEGPMNVVDAIKRSCNTWFYRAAINTGAAGVTSMAKQFNLGEYTGICLKETPGLMPTPEWWRLTYRGSNMSQGDLANISIGQGDTLVTPLQDCMMMCAIARGHSVPKPRLVQQVQDIRGNIIEFFPPEHRIELKLQSENLALVRAGMRAVVEEGDGTGKAARNPHVDVAGKTGTAQWKKDKYGEWVHLAWFSGFIPAKDPQYAFAAVYEGDHGEDSISGGRKVAPIIGDVFEDVYNKKKKRGESLSGPTQLAENGEEVRKAKPTRTPTVVQAPPPQPEPVVEPAPRREGGLRGLWRRLRGK